MIYSKEKKRIFDYVTRDGKIIELEPGRGNEKKYYEVIEQLHNGKDLSIRYPGYKTTSDKCDYCVYLVDICGEHPVSHVEIMRDIYSKTQEDNFFIMKKYIEDVAKFGYGVDKQNYPGINFQNGFDFEELTLLMFYIAIQEDINYPRWYHQGRKMCFYRYIEAAYCKVYKNHSLEEAISKAKVKNYIPQNWDDVGELYQIISEIKR